MAAQHLEVRVQRLDVRAQLARVFDVPRRVLGMCFHVRMLAPQLPVFGNQAPMLPVEPCFVG